MVEFVVGSMALLLLIFGTVEFGRALSIYHTVSNAARIGSRWAIVRGSASCTPGLIDHCNAQSTDVATYVQSQAPIAVDSGSMTVTASWPGGNAGCSSTTDFHAKGCVVIVTAQYNFKSVLPFISTVTVPMVSSSQMYIAQ